MQHDVSVETDTSFACPVKPSSFHRYAAGTVWKNNKNNDVKQAKKTAHDDEKCFLSDGSIAYMDVACEC